MSDPKPRPDLWTRAALVVATLRRLLRACAPEAFASISAEASALLAADVLLPPARDVRCTDAHSTNAPSARGARAIIFFRWRSIPAAGQDRTARPSRLRSNGLSSGKPPPSSLP